MNNDELKTILAEINAKLDELLELFRDSGFPAQSFQ